MTSVITISGLSKLHQMWKDGKPLPSDWKESSIVHFVIKQRIVLKLEKELLGAKTELEEAQRMLTEMGV